MAAVLTVEEIRRLPALPSLPAVFASVPDPRRAQGRRYALGPVLTLAVCAMLCGARSLYAIAQWGRDQDAELWTAIGITRPRTPCVATLHLLFKRVDRAALEAALGQWFAQQGLAPGEGIALDGKALRGIHGEDLPGVHLVAAYAHRAGVVLAQGGGGGQTGGAQRRPCGAGAA
jgi:DDE_Tnp_1-associated